MNEIRILTVVWDGRNEAHIWERHQLTRAEVKEQGISIQSVPGEPVQKSAALIENEGQGNRNE